MAVTNGRQTKGGGVIMYTKDKLIVEKIVSM